MESANAISSQGSWTRFFSDKEEQIFKGTIVSLEESSGTIKFWRENKEEEATFTKFDIFYKNEAFPRQASLLEALELYMPVTLMVKARDGGASNRFRATMVNIDCWSGQVGAMELVCGSIDSLNDSEGTVHFQVNDWTIIAKVFLSEHVIDCPVTAEEFPSLLSSLKVGMPVMIMVERCPETISSLGFKVNYLVAEVKDNISMKFYKVELLGYTAALKEDANVYVGTVKYLSNSTGVISFIDGNKSVDLVFKKQDVFLKGRKVDEGESLLNVLKAGMNVSFVAKRNKKLGKSELISLVTVLESVKTTKEIEDGKKAEDILTKQTGCIEFDTTTKNIENGEIKPTDSEPIVNGEKVDVTGKTKKETESNEKEIEHIECAVGIVTEILLPSSGKLEFKLEELQTATFSLSDLYISGKRCKVDDIAGCIKCGDKCSFTAIKPKIGKEYVATCVWKGNKPSVNTIFEEYLDLVPGCKYLSSENVYMGCVAKLAPPKCALILVDNLPVLLFVSSMKAGDSNEFLKRTDWIQDHLQVGSKITLRLYKHKVFNSEFPVVSVAWSATDNDLRKNTISAGPKETSSALALFRNSSFKGVTGVIKSYTSPITGIAECTIRGMKMKSYFSSDIFCVKKESQHNIKSILPAGSVIYCHGATKVIDGKIKFVMSSMWKGKKDSKADMSFVKLKQGSQYSAVVCEKRLPDALVGMVVNVPVLIERCCFAQQVWEQLIQGINFGSTLIVVVQKVYGMEQEFDWIVTRAWKEEGAKLPLQVAECKKEILNETVDQQVRGLGSRLSPSLDRIQGSVVISRSVDQVKSVEDSNIKLDGRILEVSDSCGTLEDVASGNIVLFENVNTFLLGLPLQNLDLSKLFSPGDTLSYSPPTNVEQTLVWFGLREFEDFSRQSEEIFEYCKARSVDAATVSSIKSELSAHHLMLNCKDVIYKSDDSSDEERDNREESDKEPRLTLDVLDSKVENTSSLSNAARQSEERSCPTNQTPETVLDSTEAQVAQLPTQPVNGNLESMITVKDSCVPAEACIEDDALLVNSSLQERVHTFYTKMSSSEGGGQFTDEEKCLLLDLVQHFMQIQDGITKDAKSCAHRGTQTTSTGPVLFTRILPNSQAC